MTSHEGSSALHNYRCVSRQPQHPGCDVNRYQTLMRNDTVAGMIMSRADIYNRTVLVCIDSTNSAQRAIQSVDVKGDFPMQVQETAAPNGCRLAA
jgi:hypothetical protein